VWASGDGGEDDDCNCDGYAASMWTISINSAINDGQNAHYDESCSSTLASTFSNGAKDPNTGVVCHALHFTPSCPGVTRIMEHVFFLSRQRLTYTGNVPKVIQGLLQPHQKQLGYLLWLWKLSEFSSFHLMLRSRNVWNLISTSPCPC